MDNFSNALNVRNTSEGDPKQKNFLKPYWDIDDSKFDWLQNVFLRYESDWKERIEE